MAESGACHAVDVATFGDRLHARAMTLAEDLGQVEKRLRATMRQQEVA